MYYVFLTLQESHQPVQPVVDESASGVVEESFTIPHECIGYAMGKQGWNVNQARKIDGIISIDFDDYHCMFIVKSEVSKKEGGEE